MKKLISMILVVVIIFVTVTIVPIYVSATTEFAGGSGTEDDPYIITNKNHLNNVRNYLAAHFKLLCDIEFGDADFTEGGDFYNDGLGFEPIGTIYDKGFSGVFDGNGYEVKNLYINYSLSEHTVCGGLFGYNSGIIKNLGVVDGDVFVSATAPSVYTITEALAGGVVGQNNKSGKVINCYNTCNVSAEATVISSYATAATVVGGVVGDNNGGDIENCYNTGNVMANSGLVKYHDNAGGVTGINSSGKMINCYNTGTVSGDYSGGISGKVTDGAVISDCYNLGTISANSNSTDCSGGIVGEILQNSNSSNKSDSIISNCYNLGKVSADDDAGGIVGVNDKGVVENCYNIGEVYSDSCAGGIVGENIDTIVKCYNLGTITGNCIGGVAGSNASAAVVKNCYNTGIISGSRAGGISGYNAYAGEITTCYNVGVVSGEEAGGIAGCNYYQSVVMKGEISKCYYLDNIMQGAGSGKDTAVKCTSAQLSSQETYVGFNFDSVWSKDLSCEYYYPQIITNWQHQIESVSVLSQPNKNTFIEGTSPDLSGATAKVICCGGTEQVVDIKQWMLCDFESNKASTQNLKIKIGKTISANTIDLICIEKSIVSIRPIKNNYVLGQPINTAGVEFQLSYNNDTTENLELTDATFDYDVTKVGTVTVNVTYKGFTDVFDITVNQRVVKSITLTAPAILTYVVGDEINLDGGYIRVVFESEDDYTETIPLEKNMLSGYRKDELGYQTVTVTYGEKSQTFMVNVAAKAIESIAVATIPDKCTYIEAKDELDVTGGKIILYYNNGTSEIIDITPEMVTGFDNTEVGEQTLIVTYNGKIATYVITIIEAAQTEPTTEFSELTTVVDEPTETTTETSAVTEPTEITTGSSVVTEPTEATTESTIVTDPTEATTESTVVTDSTEATTESTVVTDSTEATTESTVVTDSTEATTESSVVTESTEITTEPSVVTDPTETTTESSAVTDPREPSTSDDITSSDTTESSTDGDTKPSEPVVDKGILGDVNGDGKVNIKDATMIQKAAAKIIELTDDEKLRADVNADNKNNVKDATAIQKFVAKIETGFPIGEPIVSKVNN